jgi:hypothetical protein
MFDQHMTMSMQVSNVIQVIYFQIYESALCLDKTTRARVINALDISRLDFQNSLLLGLPECEVKRLQRAQSAAARLLTGTKRQEHITPVLERSIGCL